MSPKNLRAAGAALMTALLATTACGSDDKAESDKGSEVAETTTTTEAAEAVDLYEFTDLIGDDATSDVIELRVDATSDIMSMELVPGESSSDVKISVTNSGDVNSDYSLTIAIESADQTFRFDTLMLYTEGVQPGASAEITGFTTRELPADATLRAIVVQRTESW